MAMDAIIKSIETNERKYHDMTEDWLVVIINK